MWIQLARRYLWTLPRNCLKSAYQAFTILQGSPTFWKQKCTPNFYFYSVTIQMKLLQRYFHMVPFVFKYKYFTKWNLSVALSWWFTERAWFRWQIKYVCLTLLKLIKTVIRSTRLLLVMRPLWSSQKDRISSAERPPNLYKTVYMVWTNGNNKYWQVRYEHSPYLRHIDTRTVHRASKTRSLSRRRRRINPYVKSGHLVFYLHYTRKEPVCSFL